MKHLRASLPKQDAKVVEAFENELKSALAEVRTSVFDVARRLSPSDSSQNDVEYEMFEDWFKTVPSGGGAHEGFWPTLQQLFVNAVDEIPLSDEVIQSQEQLKEILRTQIVQIKGQLPAEADMRRQQERSGGTPPIASYMQEYSAGPFSSLVNQLASQVGEFGPLLQEVIMNIFRQAGLGGLLEDGTADETLKKLLEQLKEQHRNAHEENHVLQTLEELAGLQKSLQYVYRWEMRPAINFLSPLQWSKNNAVDQLAVLLESSRQKDGTAIAEALKKTFAEHPIPGMEDSMEKHTKVFGFICHFALIGINAVLDSGRCSLTRIADDFVRDFQARIALSASSEQAWKKLLRPLRGYILGDKIAAIRANSERLRKFRESVDELGKTLP